MRTCTSEGRDCIERKFARSFNCSVTCDGVYAGVQWASDPIEEEVEHELVRDEVDLTFEGEVGKDLMKLHNKMRLMYSDLEKKMELMKENNDQTGEELDKAKFKKLISEYKKFKVENVRHFRFHSNAASSMFGKSCELTSTSHTEEIHI